MTKTQLDPTFAFRTRSCLNEFILRYPDSPLRVQAREHLEQIADRLAEKEFRLGVMWAKMKRYRAAILYFDEVLQKYPSSNWVPESLFWKGRSLRERHQFDEAMATFQLLIDSFPEHRTTPEARSQLEDLQKQQAEERASDTARRQP